MNKITKSKRLPFKSYIFKAIVAVLITLVLNITVYYIGKTAGAFPETITIMGGKPLQLSNVVMMTFLGTFIGMLVYAAVGSLKVFRIIAVIVFILLIFSPISIANTTTSFIIFLEIMHIVATVTTLSVACWKTQVNLV